MRFSFKIFLAFFLLIALAAYLFFSSFMAELKPGFRQASEESLVDIANILAEIAADEIQQGQINQGEFTAAVQRVKKRDLNAQIWSQNKHRVDIQVYITNVHGQVIYDSENKNLGADYSLWNDVFKTLNGQYGARSTLSNPDNPMSTVMHVAAPVYHNEQIIAVLTVKKPNLSVEPFFEAAKQNLSQKGFVLLVFALLTGLFLSFWLSRSLRQLADYANTVQRGENIHPPKVYGTELTQLSDAMSSMKEKLDGSQYIEQYIHTLTHQLKSPVASIKGAAELLTEDMPADQQQRFIKNIANDANKLQLIIQYMLSLAEIENRQSLTNKQLINLDTLLANIIQTLSSKIKDKSLKIQTSIDAEINFDGEPFLIEQAIFNLIDNAISFSSEHSVIKIYATSSDEHLEIVIEDQGSGIPDFAFPHIFERFYSLPRTGEKQKSTGLGLCFVKEIARLHGGNIELQNREPDGAIAKLTVLIS